ncbi:Putative Ferric reductase like transmembrane component [[Torrubiella] hemipterigena]|uniref:Putative Ferric reductase like transmembrane component n=1 Tax=[Torrubiella] hemipterigena TaxID=1531966 RepID=A0A0A1TD35_9HYPO|nr:Putative Ferric reductase like transmembrane component [[Torrubiella] hemipterigena]
MHIQRGPAATNIVVPTRIVDVRINPTTQVVAQTTTAAVDYSHSLVGVNQELNLIFQDVLWVMLGIMGTVILVIRIMEILWAKLRQVSAMSVPREKQTYWKISQWSWMPGAKQHLIYAPLWKKRHNREFRLSSAINVGTLPSRLHFTILTVYLLNNIIYMFLLNWGAKDKMAFYADLRGRAGVLAVVNMMPLIIMAGRNNPLIVLLKISFDTYNLLHRWLGRLVVIETCLHAFAWWRVAMHNGGWQRVQSTLDGDFFYLSGLIGTVSFILLLILCVSPLRHAFYETFLNIHILLAFIAVACTWIHLGIHGLAQLPVIMAIAFLWFFDRFFRFVRLAYANWSDKGVTEALVEAMPCEATRVTVRLPRYMAIKPGTHAYLRFWGVNAWESHPFSIAWVEHETKASTLPVAEKEPLNAIDRANAYTSVSFIIGAQTGLTRKLFDKATRSVHGIRLKAAFEGPYAGHHNLDSYGHLVLFAGSTGITHQISYLRHLLEGYNAGTVATRKITLVWTIREYESLEWVRPYMDTILRIPNRKDLLRIQVFVTRPQNPRDIVSSSSTVKMFPGRPNVRLLLVKEVQEQVGAMAVTVCGPGGLADDVRAAVRAVQGASVIDFIEESFTW